MHYCCAAAPLHGVHVTESASDLVADCVSRAKEAAAKGVLLRIPFETLFEYLQVLTHPPLSCLFTSAVDGVCMYMPRLYFHLD